MKLIATERLNIKIASNDEMQTLIADEPNEDLKTAYGEMLKMCEENPNDRMWYAAWFVELKSGEKIGELCFKGIGADGGVEIGYGLHEEHWNKGYATEAVTAVAKWASKQSGVEYIEAETDYGNVASQRVLEKSGFVPTGKIGEEGPRFVWCG